MHSPNSFANQYCIWLAYLKTGLQIMQHQLPICTINATRIYKLYHDSMMKKETTRL